MSRQWGNAPAIVTVQPVAKSGIRMPTAAQVQAVAPGSATVLTGHDLHSTQFPGEKVSRGHFWQPGSLPGASRNTPPSGQSRSSL